MICGVIAEYNPFHNGHEYQLAMTRRLGAEYIVAVMSPNFVQRGGPAALEKGERANAALCCGADLVLELPTPYAMATAQRFAFGAVSILGALGCVDAISFGSECGDAAVLQKAAKAVSDPVVENAMKKHLERGLSFAAARTLAVDEIYGKETAVILESPNNTLGVEYLRQIAERGFAMTPLTIKRRGAGHHSQKPQDGIASASSLREKGGPESWDGFVPAAAAKIYEQAQKNGLAPANPDALNTAVLAKLRSMSPEELLLLPDISEGLENRLYKAIRSSASLPELLENCKTKRYPLARLRRIVYSAYLGLTAQDAMVPPPYLRVLGCNPKGREILALARKTATLPLSHQLAKLEGQGGLCARYAALESRCTDLFTLALPKVLPCGYDYTRNSVR